MTWIPKHTAPALQIGDVIVPEQGLAEDEIESIPTEGRLTVQGYSQFGGRTQYVYMETST